MWFPFIFINYSYKLYESSPQKGFVHEYGHQYLYERNHQVCPLKCRSKNNALKK
jgi:hypothetical protein